MKSNYTTFSEAGKRRANQDVCRVIEFPEYDRTFHRRAVQYELSGVRGDPWMIPPV